MGKYPRGHSLVAYSYCLSGADESWNEPTGERQQGASFDSHRFTEYSPARWSSSISPADARGVSAAGLALRDASRPYDGMADGWERGRTPVYRLPKLPPPDTGRPGFCSSWSPSKPTHSRWCTALIRYGPGQSHQWIHVLLPALLARSAPSAMPRPALCRPWPSGLGVSEADAATVAVPLEEVPVPVAPLQPPRRPPPFCP